MGWANPTNTVDKIIQHFENAGFKLPKESERGIHTKFTYDFMKSFLDIEPWVENLILTGVDLEINLNTNETYFEPNNLSAIKHMSHLREKIRKWEREGHVIRLKSKPRICSPLTVVEEYNRYGQVLKHRPCLDSSRFLNLRTPVKNLKMDTWEAIQGTLKKNFYLSTYDCSNMYFSFKLNKKYRDFFNFAITNENGETEYYQFLVMVYGWRNASYVVSRFCKAIKKFVHRLGIIYSCYIDDSILCAKTYIECEQKTRLLLFIYQACGFVINYKKSSIKPEQKKLFLGFLVDTVHMRFLAEDQKIQNYIDSIHDILRQGANKKPVPSKIVAGVLGKLASIKRSNGDIVRLLTRFTQHELGKIVTLYDWDSFVTLDENCMTELSMLANSLHDTNGQYIVDFSNPSLIENQAILNMCHNIKYTNTDVKQLLVSDSSSTNTFLYYNGEIHLSLDYSFQGSELEASSTFRELIAIRVFLQFLISKQRVLKNKQIYWQSDNLGVTHIFHKGSRNLKLQTLLLQIKSYQARLGVNILATWTPRSHYRILVADHGSRRRTNSDEWGVNRDLLRTIFQSLGVTPTLDAFSFKDYSVCREYFTLFPVAVGERVNFFAQDLDLSKIFYICPPLALVTSTLLRIFSYQGMEGIFVTPSWPSQAWWPLIFDGKNFVNHFECVQFYNTRLIDFNDVGTFLCKNHVTLLVAYFKIKPTSTS